MLHKDLLSLEDWSCTEIQHLIDFAFDLKVRLKMGERLTHLAGQKLVLLFYERSTRTKMSFIQAAHLGGAQAVTIAASESSVTKGESLVDTVRTLEAIGASAIALRHPAAGAATLAASRVSIPVINAGDGWHAHPTQTLLDLLTIQEKYGHIDGLTVAIIGDILHSRVARSNIDAFSRLGARVKVAGPPTLLPTGLSQLGAEIVTDPAAAIFDADIIYLLRIQSERQAEGYLASLSEYNQLWGLNRDLLAQAPAGALVMHPGPANIGLEVNYDVASSPQALFTRQVSNGVAVRLAVLTMLLRGEKQWSKHSQAVAF
ncbi:MAG: aspartate carbamoyltransferase catalytic subunit [Firmicutes bacterium]|nr:aspartate carbamoyltransferase catalytic subunit [Bacillota bacterium]